MGLSWFRQREEMDADDSATQKPLGASRRPEKQTKVTANAFTLAQNAIAKAMKSSRTEVAGNVAFA